MHATHLTTLKRQFLPFLLELRSEVKVTVTQKQYVTLCTTGYIPNQIWDSLDMFLELKPEVKVTVTRKQYATLRGLKMYPQTKFGIPASYNIGILQDTIFLELRLEVKVKSQ